MSSPRLSQTYLSGKKIESQKRGGGGNDQNVQYIFLGKRKTGKNCIKTGGKALNWAATLFAGEKINLDRREGGGIIEMHNIYPCLT